MICRSIILYFLVAICGPTSARPEKVFRFDMGSSDSPVAEDFVRITKADVYTPETGHGWSRAVEADFDRTQTLPYWVNFGHTNTERKDKQEPHWAPTNFLTRDGVQDTSAIEFVVDVPNGEYWVRVTCGDPYRSCFNLCWDINGETALHNLSTRTGWGGFVTDRTSRTGVKVDKGRIIVRFTNLAEERTVGELPTFDVHTDEKRTYQPLNSVNAIQIHAAVAPVLTFRDGQPMLRDPADDSSALQQACRLYRQNRLEEAVRASETISGPRAMLLRAHLLTWIAGSLDYERDVDLVLQAQSLASDYHQTHPQDWDSGELAITCAEFVRAAKQSDIAKPLAEEYGPIVLAAKRLSYAADGLERFQPGEALYEKALWYNLRAHYGDQGPFHQNPSAESFASLLRTLLTEYPQNETLRIYNGEEIPWGTRYLPSNVPTNAPEWAVLAREILARCNTVVEWWITHRQAEDGQLGGGWGDDCELLRRWPVVLFCGESPIVHEGVFRLIDGLWDSGILTNGYQTQMADVEHSAEPSSDTQPWGMVLRYGDPKYVERNMLPMQLFGSLWSGVTTNGNRLFRSNIIGALGIKTERPHTVDLPYHGRAMRQGEFLLWYNNHPAFLDLYGAWMKSWVEATERAGHPGNGKPAGLIPAAIRFEDGSPDGHGPNWTDPNLYWSYYKWPSTQDYTYEHLLSAYRATSDPRFLKPLHSQVSLYLDHRSQAQADAEVGSLLWAVARLDRFAPYAADLFWHGAGIEDYNQLLREKGSGYTRFLLTGDEAPLIEEMQEAVQKMRVNFPQMTNLVMYTDRMPLHRGPIFSMFTGGFRMHSYPTYHVTWRKAKIDDFAALVIGAGRDCLSVRLYNFDTKPMPVRAHLWRLEPGEYGFSLEEDKRQERPPNEPIHKETWNLEERGQGFDFEVPPQRPLLMQLKQRKRFPVDTSPKADLAIGPDDIGIEKETETGRMHITVHNIGIARSGATSVAIVNSDGNIIAAQPIPPIDWSRDLNARTHTVVVSVPIRELNKTITIYIDRDRKVQDAVRLNNSILLSP